eukprot:scaffold1376_cov257-Pinguiococcus_pyrenoidosus.AAC.32
MSAPRLKLVAEGTPVLLHEDPEAFDRAEVRIQQDLRHGAQLGCAVPPVAAVDEDAASEGVHLIGNERGAVQQHSAVPRPQRRLQPAQEPVLLDRLRCVRGLQQISHGVDAGSHVVDVLDVAELDLRVLVVRRRLHPFALYSIPHRGEGFARIHYPKLPRGLALEQVCVITPHP